MTDFFDIIVIGGGHAGAEAAWAGSHMLGDRGGGPTHRHDHDGS
jgi:tRNA U34 5-carboxymethylaminomethyl modifying enzyme MnmG/GidA